MALKLKIPAHLERKLMAYVQGVNAEIAGMGAVEMRDDGNLWVTDIAIYDQEVTGGTADLSPQALAFFQTDLVKRGISPKNWYLWWHSHSTMGAFFSTTDTGTIESSTEFDHVVSLVVNKKGERKCRLDTHRPFRLTMENITVEVVPEVTAETAELDGRIDELMEELDALMKQRTEIVSAPPEGIAEEIAEKVRVKYYTPALPPGRRQAGFHANQGGKKNRDDAYLDEPFNESWSKKRKKGGTVTIEGREVNLDDISEEEILLLVDETEKLIRAHVANGNGDSVECEELRADLQTYASYLDFLNDASQFDSVQENGGIIDLSEYGLVWDKHRGGWVYPDEVDDDHIIIAT